MKTLIRVTSIIFFGMATCLNAAVHEMFPQEDTRGGRAITPQAAMPGKGAGAVRSRVVPLAQQRPALPAVADKAVYPFFADVAYTTTVSRVSQGFGNAEIVEGETGDSSVRSLTIYTPEGTRHEIHGAASGLVYVAVSLPDGTMTMQAFNPSLEPSHCGNDDHDHLDAGARRDETAPQLPANITTLAAGDTEIDLMMVFDTGAAAWATSSAGGVVTIANSAVARMNTVLADSGIACVIRLVGTHQPSYTSNGNLEDALNDITFGRNGLGSVATQRNTYGADVVSFMIDTGSAYDITGLGWVDSQADYAFSACAVRAVNISHTMTHEIGHNFGCGHSKTQPGGNGSSVSYAAGLHFTGNNSVRYHTIMAYDSDGTYSYQPCNLFSSPLLTWQGVPTGVANGADNARRIRETKAVMAAFRSPVTQSVTVAFDAQQGTVSPTWLLYSVGQTYGYLPAPTRTGFNFDGWYTSPNGGGTKITTASTVLSSVITLYAKWLSSSLANDNFINAVTLSGASGTISASNVGASIEAGEPTHSPFDSESVWWKWTAPTSALYLFNTAGSSFDTLLTVFTGNALASLTQVAYNDNADGAATSLLVFNTVAGTTYHIRVAGFQRRGAITLNWMSVPLRIETIGEFVSGAGVSGAIPVNAGGAWNVAKPAGATWITYGSSSGNGSATFQFTVAPNTTGALRSATLTFTAGAQTHNYEIIQNSLTWHVSKSDAMSAAQAAAKKVLMVAGRFTCNNTRNTRTVVCEDAQVKKALEAGFVIWYCDVDASSEWGAYSGGGTLPFISAIDPNNPNVAIDNTRGPPTVATLLPRLISVAPLVTVTFDTQDGNVALETRYAKPGTKYGALPEPSRPGHTFNGWYTTPATGGTHITTQTTVTISTDHTLYARWTSTGTTTLTVTFNAQGGNVSPASKTVNTGAPYDTLPIPTRSGHLFDGWYMAPNGGGGKVLSVTLVTTTANHTLHAKWTALPSGATVYYVDGINGNDSANGTTPTTAKKTIQAAITLANAGSAILVLDGVYAPISTSNKSIIIQSLNGAERTIIDGGNTQRCATLGGAATDTATVLTGFTLCNGLATALPENEYQIGGGSVYGTINECVYRGNYAMMGGGGSAYGVLNRCTFFENSTFNSGGGSTLGTIRNSLYYQNEAGYGGGGANNSTLINCTVKGNSVTESIANGGGVQYGTAQNCIIWGNTAPGGANDFSGTKLSYSCTPSAPSSDGNISSDPLFIDAEGRLAQNSPCKNTGSNSYAFGDFDLDGNTRILNTSVDMGAYEVVAAAPSTAVPATPVPVEYAWINQYYAATTSADYITVANSTGANGIPVWQSYVAFINPTDPASTFKITGMTLNGGTVELTCDPYRPDIRRYEIRGSKTLERGGTWGAVTSDSRFFKMEVSLP